jgi:hypothetical protein
LPLKNLVLVKNSKNSKNWVRKKIFLKKESNKKFDEK